MVSVKQGSYISFETIYNNLLWLIFSNYDIIPHDHLLQGPAQSAVAYVALDYIISDVLNHTESYKRRLPDLGE